MRLHDFTIKQHYFYHFSMQMFSIKNVIKLFLCTEEEIEDNLA